MTWMGILKGVMWDEFARKVQNDEFPTDMKEYVVYSKLMRDNKKAVDWYLEKGKSSSTPEKKKLFKLILGEMRRGNNFNYWMTDQEGKMLKAYGEGGSRKEWVIPHDSSMWFFIFTSDEQTEKFINTWEEKKNFMPKQGSLGKAAKFLNRSKLSLFGLMRRVGQLDGRAYREKQQEWEPRYEKLKPIMDEIIGKDSKGNIVDQKLERLNVFEKEVLKVLNQDSLDRSDWENLESILSNHYEKAPVQKEGQSDKDYNRKLNRWENNIKESLQKLADKFGDKFMLKHTNLPEENLNLGTSFPFIYAFIENKDFRSEDSRKSHGAFYDDEYDVVKPVTLEQAKKYLDKYSSIKKHNVGDKQAGDYESYSFKTMALKHNGDGFLLLSKLGKTTGGKKLWVSKVFREILDINTSLDEHDQWKSLQNKVNREFKFNTESIMNTYLEESFKLAESGNSSNEIETMPIGDRQTKEKYKDSLRTRIGNDDKSKAKFNSYQKGRTSDIERIIDSLPQEFVDFISTMNEGIQKGEGDGGFKDDLVEALGLESAEDYIGVIMGNQYPKSHGFRQRGSASRGASGEQIITYSLPQVSNNVLLPLTQFINDAYGLFYEGKEPEGDWSGLEYEWETFKENYEVKDVSIQLEQFGSFGSGLEEITDKISKGTTKLLAEYIYLIYLEGAKLMNLVQGSMKKEMTSTDYNMGEFIRVFYAAEESFVDGHSIHNVVERLDNKLNKAPQDEKVKYLLDYFEENGKIPFFSEIQELENTITKSIDKIKTGLSTQIEKNLERIIKNKRRLKGEVYWMLEDLVREGFITVKGKGEEE